MSFRNILKGTLKVFAWSVFGVVLAISAALICAVKILKPEHLTPLVERVGNEFVEGDLKLGRLSLGFRPAFPILGVEIDSLTLISHAFDSLSQAEKGRLPEYADTLITLDYMSGALDIKRFLANNEISLHDVVIRGVGVNMVIAHNGKGNYEIMNSEADSTASRGDIPGFRINRFALENPKAIRFFNAADSTAASVLLLTDAAVDGNDTPTYRLKIDGNITSPQATLVTNLDEIEFGMNGKVHWDPTRPGLVALDDMEIRGAFLRALVNGEIDIDRSPIVRSAKLSVPPTAITDLLTLLPDSVRRIYRLEAPYFRTDAAIGVDFELTEPMNLATDTLPAGSIHITVLPAQLRYGKAILKEIAAEVHITTHTNAPDSTLINVAGLTIAGPATRLDCSALISTPLTDPQFDAKVIGNVDLSNLPPVLQQYIPGYLSGRIQADIIAQGNASMFAQDKIHLLNVKGGLKASEIYFLSADTNKMVELGKANIKFTTHTVNYTTEQNRPLMGMQLDIDTVSALIDGVDLSVGKLELGLGAENTYRGTDTTLVIPLGGKLNIDRLRILSVTDSAGARIRNVKGHVLLRRFRGHNRIPEIIANLTTGRVSAGSRESRILINDAKIDAKLHKLPDDPTKREIIRRAERIHARYPNIPPDSVFRLAIAKREGRPHKKRVFEQTTADSTEVLAWALSNGFHKFIEGWKIEGAFSTRRARMLTPFFPLRNSFSKLDLTFNNDTVNISNISIRVGSSDLTMSGKITNVRRALTAKTRNTLKVNLDFMSDTIDVNQLSAGVFAGAAYAEQVRRGHISAIDSDDDTALESRLDALAKQTPDTAGPILIPVNIDANLRLKSNHVLYSDLSLANLGGDLLVYGGGVNLHNIRANSDAGNINFSALYSAPRPENMHFGFGMELEDFNIGRFVKLVPAVDSIIPLIHDFAGTIDANLAVTCRIDSGMNLVLPSLDAAIRLTGDNLAFINPDTYRTLGKWLRFKDKTDNTIKYMNVEMTVNDGIMRVYPFAFDIDRYRLGVSGFNDMAMNFDYHIAVLKSPLPFKFGITVSGNPDKYKVRFGGAKFKENSVVESMDVVNNARVNLLEQIENVFKRGVQNSRFARVQVAVPKGFDNVEETGLSHSDSLQLIREGLIDAPLPMDTVAPEPKKKHKKFLFF